MRVNRKAFAAAAVSLMMVMSACGSNENSGSTGNTDTGSAGNTGATDEANGGTADNSGSGAAADNETVTLQMFSLPANTSGLQENWWANILQEKVGVKLELLPSGDQGEQKLQALMAGGELPDIVVFKTPKQVSDAVRANMLLNLDDYADKLPNLVKNAGKSLQYYRDIASNGTGKAYSVGNAIGKGDVMTELNYGPSLRWDLYKKLGMPEINTMEDYLPLLKKMQDLEPKTADGQRVYGFSLWKDWDSINMEQATQPSVWSGIDTGDQLALPFLQVNIGTGETKSILDADSEYIRALKFYYQANQMGLVDPDSLTQRFDTSAQKVQQGRVLFGWWPWYTGGYNTLEHMNAANPSGFRSVLPKDYKAFWWGENPIGSSWSFAISASSKHVDAALRYLDFMYSTDGMQLLMNGPKGVTWDVNDKGEPYVTDQGWDMIENNKDLPGGGKLGEGTGTVNSYGLSGANLNPSTGQALNYGYWPSSQGRNPSKLMKDWQDTTGFKSTTEMLKAQNRYTLTPLAMKLVPPMDDDMNAFKNKIGDVVKTNSWLAVFSKNENEFNSYVDDMRKKAEGLGVQKVLDWDMQAWKTAQESAAKYQ
ncbi:extracellular solute-binding protein [Paenibacillus sp. R14(2021)]|uniref:extracellular solute-binding protein n=1 Tax=Paenibacillus sp. R14(2021) TaxID=2859228 RepID=UPI001C613633|nr:extracellular solute-binding protein [Paenibacillus sp. R14(2021)]